MPRSAADATRFTSTTPHASAKSPPLEPNLGQPARQLPIRTPGPPGETPQERVRRLRAAAAKARDAKLSTFDKVLVSGRVWADRAHRFTALSLIAITGITGFVTAYALGDMIIYNRRKRREYILEQQALHAASVQTARKAGKHGIATDEQLALVESEDKYLDAKEKPGILAQTTSWLFAGLKKEEKGEELVLLEGTPTGEANSTQEAIQEMSFDAVKSVEDKKSQLKDFATRAFEAEKERQRSGGPLDRIGTNSTATEEPSKSGGGWTSFLSRR